MRSVLAAGAVLCVLGCGDGGDATPDATPDTAPGSCAPTPGPLPTEGELADPAALALPATCVVGGLADLPGRWFVVDPVEGFRFHYPRYEGSCTDGFRRSGYVAQDDRDISDGFTFHTWSDGTRFYYRESYRYERMDAPPFEFTFAYAACLLPDGTLAAVEARYDTDRGLRNAHTTGTRFGLKDGPATGLTLVGAIGQQGAGLPIIGYNVVVDGDHAYVVGRAGFDVIDVSNPALPVHVGHIDGAYNDVKVVRGNGKLVAFVSPISNQPTRAFDVTVPALPTALADLPEYSHSVFVETVGASTFLYLATYTDSVPKYDVTNPLQPIRIGAATVPGELAGVHDLFVANNRLYVNNTTAGFVVLDVSAGLAAPVELGRTPAPYSHASFAGTAGGKQIILHGDEGMTKTAAGGAYLRVFDGDPSSSTFMSDIGKYQSRPEVGIHNIQLVGNKAYIAYYQDGVRVVDLADPTEPREVAHYNTWNPDTASGAAFEGAIGIRVVNGLIYVADSERGLLILREQ